MIRVADVVGLAAGQFDQLPVGVAAHPGDPVAEAKQPVAAIIRLADAVLTERNGEWTESRRCMGLETRRLPQGVRAR